jgi:hypothetical protein
MGIVGLLFLLAVLNGIVIPVATIAAHGFIDPTVPIDLDRLLPWPELLGNFVSPGTSCSPRGSWTSAYTRRITRTRCSATPISLSERSIHMPIVVNLDVMLARRKMRLNELADLVGIRAKPLGAEDGQGEGHPVRHAREALRGARLPARRSVRVRES